MDLNDIMKNVQQMGSRMQEQQAQLKTKVVEGTAGGGMVTAKMNGAGDLVGLDIEKSVIDPEDPEMLADLVIAAVNAARKEIVKLKSDSVRDMTGGIDPSQFGINLEGLM